MKLWLVDIRIVPEGFRHCRSVNEAIRQIQDCVSRGVSIELLDMDHDLGDYAFDGGDGIKLIDWLVENDMFPPVRLHIMNPVGRDNMSRTIGRYWPK